ncbi:MAG: hypothetical protein OQK95_01595 [Gammaproteobacteria bacterium]|nr:hypothetical protein [Gammaproteobacteria bacterium]
MSDCCSSSCDSQSNDNKSSPRKLACPENQLKYVQVPVKTMLHHLKEPWKYYFKDQAYYFCTDTDCDVAYFAEDGSVINKTELRTALAGTEKYEDKVICFCFGVTLQDAKANPGIKAFVMQHTKLGTCDCETRNPSGHCCLKNFP